MYERIRELRTDKDLTQYVLADYLGMSQTGYSKYEMGTNDIPTAVLISLAKLYNTSTDYILGLTDETKPYKPKQK
jgi:transcriptional regulator with XRE-family HTH domain